MGDASEPTPVAQRRDQAAALLANREYTRAISVLADVVAADASADNEALLALACFHAERYPQAAEHYRLALAQDGDNADWRAMQALCEANAAAGIQMAVPPRERFERAALLAPPAVAPGTLPSPLPPAPRGVVYRALRPAGNVLGVVTSLLFDAATHCLGRLAGYRGAIWTNWYRRPLPLAVLTLAYMRELLNRHNLEDSYPATALTAFQPDGQRPPAGVTHFRTADGSWNNLANPKEGAAYTRFLRNVADDAARPETGEALLTPNPREISRVLLTRDRFKAVPFLNLLAAAWIQFENHDWIRRIGRITWPFLDCLGYRRGG